MLPDYSCGNSQAIPDYQCTHTCTVHVHTLPTMCGKHSLQVPFFLWKTIHVCCTFDCQSTLYSLPRKCSTLHTCTVYIQEMLCCMLRTGFSFCCDSVLQMTKSLKLTLCNVHCIKMEQNFIGLSSAHVTSIPTCTCKQKTKILVLHCTCIYTCMQDETVTSWPVMLNKHGVSPFLPSPSTVYIGWSMYCNPKVLSMTKLATTGLPWEYWEASLKTNS